MGTRVLSPEGKARPGRDADHSPPSNAKVKNEYELYFLSSLAPALRSRTVLLYFTLLKRRSISTRLYAATSQETAIFNYCQCLSAFTGVVYKSKQTPAVSAIYHRPLIAYQKQAEPETFYLLLLLVLSPFWSIRLSDYLKASFNLMSAAKCYQVTLFWPN
jgi:hypothetical protein